MTSFSGVTFVLFCFVFVEAAAFRSIVLRCASAAIATHHVFFFSRCRFFLVFFCTISAFSLYGEYFVVRSFLPDVVFLHCDHALDF